MKRRMQRSKGAISAVADAMVFFLVMSAASGVLFLFAGTGGNGPAAAAGAQELSFLASDIHCSAMECTIGPVNYSRGGADFTANRVSVLEAICLIIALNDTAGSENLSRAVNATYRKLVDSPNHFALYAQTAKCTSLLASDRGYGAGKMGKFRATSSAPLSVDGQIGALTFYLWR